MNEAFYQQMIETTDVVMIALDANGNVLTANPSACAFFGYEKSGFLGLPVFQILSFTDLDDIKTRMAAQPRSAPARGLTATTLMGATIPVATTISSWRSPEGDTCYSLALRDVQAELAVERSTQAELIRASNAIQGANIAVFEYDVLADEAIVSDIWREALEIAPGETLDVQAEWRGRVHPEDLEAALAPVVSCLEDNLDRASCEYRMYTRDRSALRWIKTDIAVAERDKDGNAIRLCGAQQDITERKEAEHALRESVDQFRSAFDNAPIGKAILGLDARWTEVNAAFCAILGFDDLVNMDPRSVIHPDDLGQDLEAFEAMLAGEQDVYQTEKRYIHASGKIVWAQLSMVLVRDSFGDPKHFISQIVDLTEHRRLQDLKSEFIASVSHELRTPVTSILGALKLLSATQQDSLSDPARKLVGISVQNSERLSQLVNDILDFEKFSVGKLRFDIKPQNVASLVAKSALQNGPYAESHNVDIVTDLPLVPTVCDVDPARLTQVITNLLSNAAKFSYAGGKVEVQVKVVDGMVRTCISNQGDGIPPSFHDKIFKPFSQAASAMTRAVGGTGLGLSISKQIVEHLGGQIGFDSEPGGQTDFWFTLPLAKTDTGVTPIALAC
ncbi:PAS domain S-box protein [uncultured Sulfitobacter sp.]|uniref:PAS domain S-box protein n=1 Tax=uncultured Sulfitobacter sp. TaxID=191468 RepID=UPI002628FA6C|nr:PAS domain S-box protein [uncultured Sulfitobacter sp.]